MYLVINKLIEVYFDIFKEFDIVEYDYELLKNDD